jgi:hypothetical protein
LTKFSSSGLPFLEPFFFFSLVFGSLFLFGCALLVLWSPSFISFFPLTYVYNMCKCGGVIRYTVRRPKYPSKSSHFLGSLSINISRFECTTSKEIYLKRTYSYVSYLSYLIILRNQCSRQNQCTAKTRSHYLEGLNI